MKFALMMENSQAAKNPAVLKELASVVAPQGDVVFNVGMCDENDHQLTYIHLGIMASLLLNSQAVDFVVAGCATGQSAMMSLNAHPGVICGYCLEPSDAYVFNQINSGNALSIAFDKGYGAELNLRYIFEKAFTTGKRDQDDSLEFLLQKQSDAELLNEIKDAISKDCYLEILNSIDQSLVKTAISGERFKSCFLENCQVPELAEYLTPLFDQNLLSSDVLTAHFN